MFETILSIVVYLAVFFLILFSKQRDVFRPSILFFIFYLLIYGIGSLLYPFMFPGQLSDSHIVIILGFFISVELGIVLGIVCLPLTNKNNCVQDMHALLFASKSISQIFLLISFLSAVLWYIQIGTIPVLANDIENARVELARGTYYLRQMVSLAVPAILFYTILVAKLRYGFRWLLFATIIEILLLASQGYRSFPLSFLLLVLIVYNISSPVNISRKTIMLVGALAIIFASMFAAYRFFSVEANIDRNVAASWIFMKDLFVRVLALDMIYEAFPYEVPFQKGLFYLRGFGFLIPGEQMSPGNWLKEEIFNLNFAGGGLNPGLVGEFYLNFGELLTYVFGFIYGIILSVTYRIAQLSRNSLVKIISIIIYFYSVLALVPGLATSFLPIIWFSLVSVISYISIILINNIFNNKPMVRI